MKRHEIQNDFGKNIRFLGKLIGQVSSSPDPSAPNYSGEFGHWQEFSVYMTMGGLFVCHRFRGTTWAGDKCSNEAVYSIDKNIVFGFFGNDELARKLYEQTKMENVEDIP